MSQIETLKTSFRRSAPQWLSPAILAIAVLFGTNQPVNATLLSYSLTISDSNIGTSNPEVDGNVPDFSLSNTSDPNVLLKSFKFTIGDTSANFDMVRKSDFTEVNPDPPSGGTLTLSGTDSINDNLRGDDFTLTLTGFDPGETITWNVDLDSDSGNSTAEQYDTTFFSNGSALNSIVTVILEFNGQDFTLEQELPDVTTFSTSYTFTDSLEIGIPEPGALALMGVGVFGLVALRRKRRTA